jgi:hypothetical protein
VGAKSSGDEGAGVREGSQAIVGEGVFVTGVEEGEGVVSGEAVSCGMVIAANVVKVKIMLANVSAIMIIFEALLVALIVLPRTQQYIIS